MSLQSNTGPLPRLTSACVATDATLGNSAFVRETIRAAAKNATSAWQAVRKACAELLRSNGEQIEAQPYPATVHVLMHKEFARIKAAVANESDAYFDIHSHRLRCDLRILTFGRVPVGPEHFEVDGFPRSTAWRGGIRQALDFARTTVEAGGWQPFYVVHLAYGIDPATFMLTYSKRAQERMFRNLAGCLELHPEIRGVLAGSWWHDPHLDTWSPHMTYLRSGWTQRGARLFRWDKSDDARRLAAKGNAARQEAIQSGAYDPTEYMVVWPRRSLIAWANS